MSEKPSRTEIRRSFFVRLAAAGFALIPLSVVVAAAADNLTGAFSAIPPLVILALVMAVLLLSGRALIPAMVVAILCFLAYFGLGVLEGSTSVAHPDSFSDFVPTLMRGVGSLLALIGLIVAIRQRRRGSLRPARPLERRLSMSGAVVLVVVAALSGVLTYSGRSAADAPPGSVVVEAVEDKFDPSELRAERGETFRVFVTNLDSYAHTFSIDDLAIDVYIGPYGDRLIAIPVPDDERRYELYCAVSGHESMNGKLIVG